jgi:hypothetical protein
MILKTKSAFPSFGQTSKPRRELTSRRWRETWIDYIDIQSNVDWIISYSITDLLDHSFIPDLALFRGKRDVIVSWGEKNVGGGL